VINVKVNILTNGFYFVDYQKVKNLFLMFFCGLLLCPICIERLACCRAAVHWLCGLACSAAGTASLC
jgi:hypothetical protein